MHVAMRGDFLKVHADHNWHYKLYTHRRVNALLYLSQKDWNEDWGGHLEMWSHDKETNEPRQCVKKILPKYNRAILFDTTHNSWHGLPEKILCPNQENIKKFFDLITQQWRSQEAKNSLLEVRCLGENKKPLSQKFSYKKISDFFHCS